MLWLNCTDKPLLDKFWSLLLAANHERVDMLYGPVKQPSCSLTLSSSLHGKSYVACSQTMGGLRVMTGQVDRFFSYSNDDVALMSGSSAKMFICSHKTLPFPCLSSTLELD